VGLTPFRPDGDSAGVLDVVAIGDICVDFLTPPLRGFSLGDRQLWVPALPMVPGGNAANFALGLAALGARVGLAACLGDDPISAFLAAQLRRRRVASFVTFREGMDAFLGKRKPVWKGS